MKPAAVLTIIGLAAATATPHAKRERPPAQLPGSISLKCPGPDYQGCNIDDTKLSCAGGVATLFTCEGGCIINCEDPGPCDPPTCEAEEVTEPGPELEGV